MKVLSWNVQGAVPRNGSFDRIERQIEYIDNSDADLLLLNEVTTVQRDFWRESLAEIGYSDVVDSLDWAAELKDSDVPPHSDINHVNGNLTALADGFEGENLRRHSPSIREGVWSGTGCKGWDTNFPEKLLPATFEVQGVEIETWNVRAVPGSDWGEEKIKILKTAYQRIRKGSEGPVILAGDFNAPRDELEDVILVPWREGTDKPLADEWADAERNILTGLREINMVDVFRHLHGYEDVEVAETSHKTRRFDHLIASLELEPQSCEYDHAGYECSDHAPLIGSFEMNL